MNRADLISAIAEEMGTMRRLSASLHKNCPLPEGSPTPAQLGILFTLFHQGPQTLKELSGQLFMTPSAATQLTDGLVRDELVTREANTDDRRKIRLSITNRGRDKLLLAKKSHIESFMKLFEVLTDQELETYLTLQRKLISHLK